MVVKTLFCDACSEEVEYNRITRDGQVELTCQFCGFTLGVGEEEASIRAECILVADNSPSVRELVKKAVLDTRLSKDVVTFENGIDFISVFAKRLTEKESMDLVVLDLEMPEMDGIIAARVMRLQRFLKSQRSQRSPGEFLQPVLEVIMGPLGKRTA